MDLDPMINTSHDENTYLNYDNRPIRPMDQDALNEALARLPILIDEDDLNNNSELNSSIRIRRQPILAYSTRRKNFSDININQSVLNTTGTPINNKRKLGVCTPMNKFIKQLDSHQDLIQLKEENKILEETKANLQLECVLLKKSHETELQTLKQEHQQIIDTLIQKHNLQYEQLNKTLTDKEQLIIQTNLELDSLRNDHMMLLLEKETLNKIIVEYQLMKEEMNNKLIENETIIKNLQEQIENHQKKQSTFKTPLINNRIPLKETSIDQSRTTNSTISLNTKNEPIRIKTNTKVSIPRGTGNSLSTANTNINSKQSLPKSKLKPNSVIDEKKKSTLTDKPINSISTRLKSNKVTTK